MASHDAVTEIFYSSAWHDVSTSVRNQIEIVIDRGVDNPGDGVEVSKSNLSLTFDGRSGDLNPRNPVGALFGLIGQNTPIRVTLDSSTRYSGEIKTWTPGKTVDWAGPGSTRGDAWVDITAEGLLGRLRRGTLPAYSAMRRAVMYDAQQPIGYWPLEGGDTTTAVAYDVIGNYPTENVDQSAAVAGESGAARFGTVDVGPGSDKLANVAGSWTLGCIVPTPPAGTGESSFCWVWYFGTEVRSGGFCNVGMRLDPSVAAKHLTFQLYVNDDTTAHLDVIEADPNKNPLGAATTISTFSIPDMYDGRPRAFTLDLEDGGGTDVDCSLYFDGGTVSGTYSASFSGALDAAPYRIAAFTFAVPASANVGFGHAAMFNEFLNSSRDDPVAGYPGELAGERFIRTCTELGLDYNVVGDFTDTQAMGPQRPHTTLELFAEIERTDDAQIYDRRASLTIEMRTGRSLLRQDPAVTLDYTAEEIAPTLLPVVGDQHIRNDVTAANPDGTTRRYVQETGPLNVQEPGTAPGAVGRYDTKLDVNYDDPDLLLDAASWRVAKGTFDGTWYQTATADLDAAPGLAADVNALDIGDMTELDGLAVDEVADGGTVRHLTLGYRETIGPRRRQVTFRQQPAAPFTAGVLGAAGQAGYLDSRATTTAEALDTTETGVDVAIAARVGWTHASGDYKIMINGERMVVTGVGAVSGSPGALTQTLTVQRSDNGVVKSHPSGVEVHVADPFILAL